jgi:hypothetical protein
MYAPPAVAARRVALEGLIAATAESLSIGPNARVAWTEDADITIHGNKDGLGSHGDSKGLDVFVGNW